MTTMKQLSVWKVAVYWLLALGSVFASDDDDRFFSDFEDGTEVVNTGELNFLSGVPERPVHHHRIVLNIEPSSLQSGWVELKQCHENLDVVPRLEISFREGRIRNLSVTKYQNIRLVQVEGPSIQLTDVGSDARICLKGESLVLTRESDGAFLVRNGPFMRRFLDGYYPIQVTMQVAYPCKLIRLAGINHLEQPGLRIRRNECRVDLHALFEGRLFTELRFLPAKQR